MELTGLLFYLVSVLIAGGIYAVLCLALNVQWGMGGLFNAGIAGSSRSAPMRRRS
jgi:branched-chain amino acid transport system permease protein